MSWDDFTVNCASKRFTDTVCTDGTYHMFDPRVLPFGVLSDGDEIHVFVGRLVAHHRFARSDVGVQVELSVEKNTLTLIIGSRIIGKSKENT